jgi:glutathione S-transferase
MKLYYSPGACSLSPHIVACEAGIELQLIKVDLKTKRTESGADFREVSPNGYVPALALDSGEVLTEGPAIVQYLADQKPGAQLAPVNGSLERYRLQQWLNFISTELHKGFSPLFDPAITPERRTAVLETLFRRFDYVVNALGSKPFVLGEGFSVADAYLYTVLNWTGFVKVDMARWPALKEYQVRVGKRPATQRALKEEGLIKA